MLAPEDMRPNVGMGTEMLYYLLYHVLQKYSAR